MDGRQRIHHSDSDILSRYQICTYVHYEIIQSLSIVDFQLVDLFLCNLSIIYFHVCVDERAIDRI